MTLQFQGVKIINKIKLCQHGSFTFFSLQFSLILCFVTKVLVSSSNVVTSYLVKTRFYYCKKKQINFGKGTKRSDGEIETITAYNCTGRKFLRICIERAARPRAAGGERLRCPTQTCLIVYCHGPISVGARPPPGLCRDTLLSLRKFLREKLTVSNATDIRLSMQISRANLRDLNKNITKQITIGERLAIMQIYCIYRALYASNNVIGVV